LVDGVEFQRLFESFQADTGGIDVGLLLPIHQTWDNSTSDYKKDCHD
jgi:hypothetical protein